MTISSIETKVLDRKQLKTKSWFNGIRDKVVKKKRVVRQNQINDKRKNNLF